MARRRTCGLGDLPDPILESVLKIVLAKTGGHGPAAVCRAWAKLCPELQANVRVTLWEGLSRETLVHELSQFPNLRSLHISSMTRRQSDTSLLALIARAGFQQLQELVVTDLMVDDRCIVLRRPPVWLGHSHLHALLQSCPLLKSLRLPGFVGTFCLGHMRSAGGQPFGLRRLELSPWVWGSQMDHHVRTALKREDALRWSRLRVAGPDLVVSKLGPGFAAYSGLRMLSLRSGIALELPASFSTCFPHLEDLSLYFSSLAALPENLGSLGSLTSLMVHSDSVTRLPQSFVQLTRLTRLRLELKRVRELPENFGQLNGLESLELGDCVALRSLPPSLSQLSRLSFLEAGGCIGTLSEECVRQFSGTVRGAALVEPGPVAQLRAYAVCGRLSRLSSMAVIRCGNAVSQLEDYMDMSRLKKVKAIGCADRSAVAPRWISNAVRLRELHISRLNFFPRNIFPRLAALEVLELNDVSLMDELPAEFGELRSLKRCVLYSCIFLSALPESFGRLESLELLELRDCPFLESLPESLGQLPKLEKLHLEHCWRMTEISQSLGQLRALKSLSLVSMTALQRLPEDVSGLVNLCHVAVDNCPSLQPVAESWAALPSLSVRSQSRLGGLARGPASLSPNASP